MFLVGGLLPVVLVYLLGSEFVKLIRDSYAVANGYPEWLVSIFGWGMAGALIVLAVLLSLIPWSSKSKDKFDPEFDEYTRRDAIEKDAIEKREAIEDSEQKGATA